MKLKRFKKIYIEITNVCNLRCSFCSLSNRPAGYMSVGLFTEIIEKIQNHTAYVYLHVKGEPLLHPDLSEILDICFEKRLSVVLVTNGTLLNRVGDMLLSKPALKQVNISMHCFSELNCLMEKDEYLKAITAFTKRAISQSQLTISLRLWNFEKSGKGGHPVNNVILSEIENEFVPGMDLAKVYKPGKGLKLVERLYLNSDVEFSWPDINKDIENTVGFCHALRDHIAILSDGTIVPCCLDAEGIINLGNICNSTIQGIFNAERAQRIYNGFSKNVAIEPLCQKCGFMQKFE